jgi:hypothetical protein
MIQFGGGVCNLAQACRFAARFGWLMHCDARGTVFQLGPTVVAPIFNLAVVNAYSILAAKHTRPSSSFVPTVMEK